MFNREKHFCGLKSPSFQHAPGASFRFFSAKAPRFSSNSLCLRKVQRMRGDILWDLYILYYFVPSGVIKRWNIPPVMDDLPIQTRFIEDVKRTFISKFASFIPRESVGENEVRKKNLPWLALQRRCLAGCGTFPSVICQGHMTRMYILLSVQ